MIFVDRCYLHFVSLEKKKLSVQLSYWLCQTAKYQRKKIEKKKRVNDNFIPRQRDKNKGIHLATKFSVRP